MHRAGQNKTQKGVKDIETVNSMEPAIAPAVAARTAQGTLSDTIEELLAAAVGPRSNVTWPQIRDHVCTPLLGATYVQVLRHELLAFHCGEGRLPGAVAGCRRRLALRY